MNINMNEKAYEYLTKKGMGFKIKFDIMTCWAGNSSRNLWSGAVKSVENEDYYDVFDFKDIKIYVHKNVRTEETIDIVLKANIPLLGPMFSVSGIVMWFM